MSHAPSVSEPPGSEPSRQGDTYRWVYDVNLMRDLTIPVLIVKVVLLAALAPALLLFIVTALEGDIRTGAALFARVYGLTAGILLALMVIAYPLYILIKGGKYALLFEMDPQGIRHLELPKSAKRSEMTAWAGFAAGLMAANPTVAGANLLAMAKQEMYTQFSGVRKIIVHRRRGVICLVSRDLTRNLIYPPPGFADFVIRSLTEHCPENAKIIEK